MRLEICSSSPKGTRTTEQQTDTEMQVNIIRKGEAGRLERGLLIWHGSDFGAGNDRDPLHPNIQLSCYMPGQRIVHFTLLVNADIALWKSSPHVLCVMETWLRQPAGVVVARV